eukprot:542533-Rhodomonas_salina.1
MSRNLYWSGIIVKYYNPDFEYYKPRDLCRRIAFSETTKSLGDGVKSGGDNREVPLRSAIVENRMGDVPFTPGKPQFDQANWLGRCRHFFAITNPAYLFATEEQLASAKAKLEGFKAGTLPPGTSNQELWKAQTLCDAVLHPDTKMPVPAMFRVCAFAPANIPICAGMLMTPPTIFNVVFWQWVNQSYNAGFNYCNSCGCSSTSSEVICECAGRNASSSMDNTKLAQVYFGATTVSVGTAVGMAQALKAAPLSAAMAAFL